MSELSEQVRAHFKPRGELYELRHKLAKVMNEKEWQDFRKVTKEFGGKRTFDERQPCWPPTSAKLAGGPRRREGVARP